MSLQWSESLATGSAEIDSQHKELFNRVNSLVKAVETRIMAKEEVSRVITYLTDYVVFHFGGEEKHMARHNYSSMAAHKAQHEQFVKSFAKLKERMLTQGMSDELTKDTKDLVEDWLLNHITYSDRALGMFLKKKT